MKRSVTMLVIILLGTFSTICLAEYKDPEVKTQINEQTTYFKDSLDNPDELMQQYQGTYEDAKKILDGQGSIAEMAEIMDVDAKEFEQTTGELSQIRAIDLTDAGRDAQAKAKDDLPENLFLDEGEGSLLKAHQQDVDKIINASEKLLGNLLGELRDLGVDCKQIKGDKIIEPIYTLEIKRTPGKDAKYDQHFCERLRNKYNCSNSLTLKCSKRGIRWHQSEDRSWESNRDEITNLGFADVFWSHKTGKEHFEIKLIGLEEIRDRYKQLLAKREGVSVDHIIEVTKATHKGWLYPSGRDKENNWSIYSFAYKYRESYEVCEKWDEDWTERCSLQ